MHGKPCWSTSTGRFCVAAPATSSHTIRTPALKKNSLQFILQKSRYFLNPDCSIVLLDQLIITRYISRDTQASVPESWHPTAPKPGSNPLALRWTEKLRGCRQVRLLARHMYTKSFCFCCAVTTSVIRTPAVYLRVSWQCDYFSSKSAFSSIPYLDLRLPPSLSLLFSPSPLFASSFTRN